MAYGEIIKKIRKNKGMSLRAFGKLVDVDFTYIGLLERELSKPNSKKLNPSIDILYQICDRASYSFRQFLEEANYIEAVTIPEQFTVPILNKAQEACADLDETEQTLVIGYIKDIKTRVSR